MGVFTGNECGIRILALGNDILADDAFAVRVAEELRACVDGGVEIVTSAASGLHLLDAIAGTDRLLVIDTLVTGEVPPGTLRVFRCDGVKVAPGGTPHSVGLFDAAATLQSLALRAPREITCIGVEAVDCVTLGGSMHPGVAAAVADAVTLACGIVEEWRI